MATSTSSICIRPRYVLRARNFAIKLGAETKIMGIINMTPDSFSEDGCLKRKPGISSALHLAERQIKEGADILDVGGESSRPGSKPIPLAEEIKRVIPVVQYLTKNFRIPVSVDTYKAEVAERALDAGASIINNIHGAAPDQALLRLVKNYKAAIVLMHMRKTPATMQKNIFYKSVVKEIMAQIKRAMENCLEMGIKLDRIIVDPGIGFGKTVNHNLEIIYQLKSFQKLNCPILIGASRKSFIVF